MPARRARSQPGWSSRGRSGGAGCCRTPAHNDHGTDVRRVHYPWHPLHGRDVLVRGAKTGRRTVLRCQVDDDDRRDNREVPTWMFDQARCSQMVPSASPSVSWEALHELRRLLDDTTRLGDRVAVETPSPTFEGIHETALEPRKSTRPDRTLRRAARSAEVVGPPATCASDTDRPGSSNPAATASPGNDAPCARGGA